jgi:undecaprenyl-diphosphatase
MGRLVDAILGLSGPLAYLVVGGLAFGEAAAFVGLFLPGEVAVLLGGVLASEGQVSLPAMLAVACLAAVAGDSVGYEIGRRYGERILRTRLLRRHSAAVERARAYVQAKGGRAVFLGRWTGVLRALVPGLAGISGMPYRRFIVANIAGGVAWASTFVLLGYAAGASFRSVERYAGRASLLLLGLIVLGVALRWAAHRAIAQQERVRALGRRIAGTPPVRWVAARYGSELLWLGRRLDPRTARGLGLTTVVAALLLAGFVVGAVVQDLLAGEELALLDAPVARWFAEHRTDPSLAVAGVILRAFEVPGVALLTGLVAGAIAVWRRFAAALSALLAAAGAVGIAAALQQVLPATAAGTVFPSTASAAAAALALVVAVAVGTHRGWAAGARGVAAGAMVVAVVGVAALVRGDSALSGVVGGAALGATWALALEVQRRGVVAAAEAPAGDGPSGNRDVGGPGRTGARRG